MNGGPIHEGGCHCRAVRYTLSAPLAFQFLCHCDSCRRLNGGMRLAGAALPKTALTARGPTASYRYPGGRGAIEQHFCPTCGTAVYAHLEAHPETVVVRANSLDDHGAFAPSTSIHGEDACAWDTVIEGGSPEDDTPRLYGELAWVWPLLSPAEDYAEETEKIVEALAGAGVEAGSRVLHLGCGGGSLDHHLARTFALTGVDRSEGMLAQARKLNPDVEYVSGDMREVRLGRTFDAVVLHDAQAYLTTVEELRATYETAAAHLEPGGVLISTPEELKSRFPGPRRIGEPTTHSDGTTTVTTFEIDVDPDPSDHEFEGTYLFLIRDENGQRVELDVHKAGIWELEEVLAPMRELGFDPVVTTPRLTDMPDGDWVLVTAKLS